VLLLPGFFVFAAFGMLTVLTTVFLANTVDYGEWKNHHRDESVIFSMQTFVVKLASGVAAMIATICLTVSKINQDTSETATVAASGQNVAVLRMTMTIAPIVGLLIALFVFAKNYVLTDKKLEEIKDALK
jgi:melibiose permease